LRNLPCKTARHSDGRDLLSTLASSDRNTADVLPGEHIDLIFDARSLGADERLIFTGSGRYDALGSIELAAPTQNYLRQNRPNPFNPATEIEFGLSASERVTLRVFDTHGRLVRVVLDQYLRAGVHRAEWDGTNSLGGKVSSGVYFYELKTGGYISRQKMILLR